MANQAFRETTIMRKHFLSIPFLICTTYSYSTITFPLNDPQANHIFLTVAGTDISINLADYIKLKPSDFKKLTGHKLTWKDIIIFKIAQKEIKKTIRKDGTVDMVAFYKKTKEPFKWHWGGFFLGMLVPIGFIVTLFIKDEKRKNRITSSLFGMAVALSIGLLIALMIVASSL